MRHAEKVAACREIFLELRGRRLHILEAAMRGLGWERFSRRILHPRKGRGARPGWIAEYGWASDLEREKKARRRVRASAIRSAIVAAEKALAVMAETAPTRDRASPRRTAEAEAAPPLAQEEAPPPDFSDFQQWLARISPHMTWTWKHQLYIYEKLKRVTGGDCKRLMIFMPPRHGKSELVTVRYTAWRLLRDPAMKVILASYGQRLADRFSRGIRRVICEEIAMGQQSAGGRIGSEPPALAGGNQSDPASALKTPGPTRRNAPPPADAGGSDRAPSLFKMFPFTSSKPINCISEWETAVGGGLRAVGVGCGVTGFGANLIVIDDPVKNRAQAESETYRNRVWDWYTDDLYTRLEPDAAIILIQTRWHEDDLAGRLLNQNPDEWEVVDLPAIFEVSSGQWAEESRATEKEETRDGRRETGDESVSSPHVSKGPDER